MTPGQHAVAPGREPSCSGHGRHSASDDDPVPALNVPAGHSRHWLTFTAPGAGLYVPAGQANARPATQYLPEGQVCPAADAVCVAHSTPSAHTPLQVALVRPGVSP